ncbi:hypothetical protein GCM10023194_40910 [Planotetraspora phitsanulokensis]|uniref:Uncharacterized protein n=1 Tax=Planotetraspora phitsanulokensis TaxID=575192 RepID=A0A8J3UCR0_9ACTN|nr:hypothetical protein [Planotetraspora phitsanulokensis]GII40921.1 hypothetical protein Pph01_59240 [Planotetraspora phitsanulokensis]
MPPRITRVDHPRKNGVWPNGEPKSVRDAYDRMVADQNKSGGKNSGDNKR